MAVDRVPPHTMRALADEVQAAGHSFAAGVMRRLADRVSVVAELDVALPADEIERLRAEVEPLRAAADGLADELEQVTAERDAALALLEGAEDLIANWQKGGA